MRGEGMREGGGVLRMCMFCGERSEDFDEPGLDQHYLRSCPMLKKCEDCKQVRPAGT